MQVWHLFLLLCLFCSVAELSFLSAILLRLHLTSLPVINEGTEEHRSQEWALRDPTQHHPLPGHWAMDYNSGCVYPANSLSTEWQFTHQIHISSVWRSAMSCGTVPKASQKSKWWHLLVFPYWLFFTRCYWNGRDYFQQMSLKIWKSHRYFDS